MGIIHFVGGEKGGVGKSVFARLLSQYFIDNSLAYTGFDADRSHASLTRYYQEYTKPVNLDYFESTDRIMETALESDSHVLVDLPAQSERFLDRWLEENDVLGMCAEMQVMVIYWYLVDDGRDSAQLLGNFLEKYKAVLNCAVIKNQGCGRDFSEVDEILASIPANPNIHLYQANLPALHAATMHKIDKLNFSFWGAVNIKESGGKHLSLMERQRTKVWQKKAYAVFGRLLDGMLV